MFKKGVWEMGEREKFKVLIEYRDTFKKILETELICGRCRRRLLKLLKDVEKEIERIQRENLVLI